jgi:hypothetical protein
MSDDEKLLLRALKQLEYESIGRDYSSSKQLIDTITALRVRLTYTIPFLVSDSPNSTTARS